MNENSEIVETCKNGTTNIIYGYRCLCEKVIAMILYCLFDNI